MSAEVLRRAANEMRDDGFNDAELLGAVADWLSSEADGFDAYMARQADPERRMNSLWLESARLRHDHALAVARAYLGESA